MAPDGTPKISDFGLAKILVDDIGVSLNGVLLGTPSYMAPEQVSGDAKDIGPATDIYALGAILYEMLTGAAPFRGLTPMETLCQVMEAEVVPPSRLRHGVPEDLETICLKCLDRDPARRYASAEELADDLKRFQENQPIHAVRASRLRHAPAMGTPPTPGRGLAQPQPAALPDLARGGRGLQRAPECNEFPVEGADSQG